eukprot:6077037-Amphidinium_carterae.1
MGQKRQKCVTDFRVSVPEHLKEIEDETMRFKMRSLDDLFMVLTTNFRTPSRAGITDIQGLVELFDRYYQAR